MLSDQEIAQAAREFADQFSELAAMTLPDDYGCTYHCTEAEFIAKFFRAVGDEGTAEEVLKAHIDGHDVENVGYPHSLQTGV